MRCLQSRLCAPCHGSTHYHVQGIFPAYGRKKPWYVQPLIDGVVLFSLYGAS